MAPEQYDAVVIGSGGRLEHAVWQRTARRALMIVSLDRPVKTVRSVGPIRKQYRDYVNGESTQADGRVISEVRSASHGH